MAFQAAGCLVLALAVAGCSLSSPLSSGKSATPTPAGKQVATRSGVKVKGAKPGPATKLKSGRPGGKKGARLTPKKTHRGHSSVHTYAVKLVPVLVKSAGVFDRASTAAATAASNDALSNVCDSFGDKVTFQESFFEGVPHPAAWYTDVGHLHHSVAGVYHDMLGAIQLCQTATSNQDSSSAAFAVSDMGRAAAHLHNTIRYVRWLTTQP
jgi:hypothetical protein